VGASTTRKQYTFDGSAWSRSGNEDRAFFAFPIVGEDTFVANNGCTGGCHAGYMSAGTGEVWDMWHWKGARTAPTHTADDKWWDDQGSAGAGFEDGHHGDEGMSSYWEPGSSTMPAYMPAEAAAGAGGASYPAWVWEAVPFDPSLAWADGDTLPGVYNRLPTGSRGDVAAVATFDGTTGTWTLELKRARFTGNGDDYQF